MNKNQLLAAEIKSISKRLVAFNNEMMQFSQFKMFCENHNLKALLFSSGDIKLTSTIGYVVGAELLF